MPSRTNYRSSPRLRAVLDVLMDGEPHTTLDLVQRSGQVAVDTCVRELRNPPNDFTVNRFCAVEHRDGGGARRVHFYQLARADVRRVLLERAAALAD